MKEELLSTEGWGLGDTWDRLIVPVGVMLACSSIAPAEITLTCALMLGSTALYIRWVRRMKANWLDGAVAFFLLCAIFSTVRSEYLPNSIPALRVAVEACLVYTLIRSSRNRNNRSLYVALLAYGALVACFAICRFMGEYSQWSNHAFTDLTHFRQQLSLTRFASYSGNEYLPFVLCGGIGLIGLSHSIAKNSWVWLLGMSCLWLNSICIVLTFSRLAYISLIVMTVLFALLAHRVAFSISYLQWGVVLVASAVAIAFLTWNRLLGPMWTTLRMSQTTSQIRSLNGRYQIVDDSFQMFKRQLWLGRGLGNFAHAFNGDARKGMQNYSSQPFNWFLQVAIEEGAIGLLSAWSLLVIPALAGLRELSTKGPNRLWGLAVLANLGAVGVFLLGQAAPFVNRHLADLFCAWLALIANGVHRCEKV